MPDPLVRRDMPAKSRRKVLHRTAQACAIPEPVDELDPAWSWSDVVRFEGIPIDGQVPPIDDDELLAVDIRTADSASGCEGRAPEGTNGATARLAVEAPVNARQSRTDPDPVRKHGVETERPEPASERLPVEPASRPAAGRSAAATSEFMDVTAGETAPPPRARRSPAALIDLNAVPSAMEARAASWRSPAIEARRPASDGAGKAWCKCGGGKDGGLVPDWFGEDCIEANCPLRARAAA